jgi:hypothetical protein
MASPPSSTASSSTATSSTSTPTPGARSLNPLTPRKPSDGHRLDGQISSDFRGRLQSTNTTYGRPLRGWTSAGNLSA